MAIARPTSKTIISTTGWGIPITDAVNANTDWITANTPGAWTPLSVQNGWTIQTNHGTASVRKIGDTVQMRGMVSGGTAGTVVAVLPTGFRPLYQVDLLAYQWPSVASWCNLLIGSDGTITVNVGSGGANFVSLAGWWTTS